MGAPSGLDWVHVFLDLGGVPSDLDLGCVPSEWGWVELRVMVMDVPSDLISIVPSDLGLVPSDLGLVLVAFPDLPLVCCMV